MLTIRPERAEDHVAIHQIHTLAFGQANEADLVDALRRQAVLTISLVAVQDDQLVGHIAFSPVTILSETETIEALGLAPMAVLPVYQRTGIGSQLVKAGLQACRKTKYGIVVVLGHPAYYPRFGFMPSKQYGIVWEHDVPEDVFMLKELKEDALAQTSGVVKYHPAFEGV